MKVIFTDGEMPIELNTEITNLAMITILFPQFQCKKDMSRETKVYNTLS